MGGTPPWGGRFSGARWPLAPRAAWKTDNTGRRQSVKDLRPDAFLRPAHEATPLMPRRSSVRGLLRARTAVLTGESDVESAAVWRQITAAVEELQGRDGQTSQLTRLGRESL